MQIRDCLAIQNHALDDGVTSAVQFYQPALLRHLTQQFFLPNYTIDSATGAIRRLLDAAVAGTGGLFLIQGIHGAGKTHVLLAASILLSGHDPDLRSALAQRLGTACPEATEGLPETWPGQLVLALDGAQTAKKGLLLSLRGAGDQALEQYGLGPAEAAKSVGDLLGTLRTTALQADPAAGIAVLVDDFDLYCQSAAAKDKTQLSALVKAAAAGEILLVLFSKAEPADLPELGQKALDGRLGDSAGTTLKLNPCLETLVRQMIVQTDEELFSQMVTRFIRQKDHYFYTHFCQIKRWGRQIDLAAVWQNYDLFLADVTMGCYPLHPFTVYIMSQLMPMLETLSMPQLAATVLEDSLDKEFVRVWPPFVYPVVLLNETVCQELLPAEQAGRIPGELMTRFRGVYDKLKDSLAPYEDAVLKGVLLVLLCRLEFVDRTDLTEMLSKCTGIYKSEEIDSAFRTLEEEYGAIAYDAAKNELILHAEPCGRKDFERQRSRALLRCGRLNCVRDCDEYLLSRLQINVPQDTGFAQARGISSSEWQWDKDFVHIESLTKEELSQWKKTISTRHNVAEHRGLLVYVYCPESSEDEISALVKWCKDLSLGDCALELMLLIDVENRFRNGVRDWNILKRFTPQEQERFRRYYDEGVKAAENQVISAFHQMCRESLFVKAEGVVNVDQRIDAYCTSRFQELFSKAPPFHFEGFERKLTNQVRNNYVGVVTRLMDDTITNPRGYQSMSSSLQTRINNCFLIGVPNSWQVLTRNCELTEPLNPQVLEIFLMAENDLLSGALTVGRLFRSKLYAPYGMNEYSLGLLICLFMIYNRNRIEISSNGVPLRPENVVSLFILKTKIRFSELFAIKLSLKTMSEEKEVLHACDEVAANRHVENCENLRSWLTNLTSGHELTEPMASRVDWAMERLQTGQALYDNLYHNIIDRYLEDMNSDKPAVRCLAAARIQVAFSDLEGEIEAGSGYYYSPQFARVIANMKTKGDTILNRFFHGELVKLDCTPAFWERFRKQYLELAEALVKCGRMDETYQLLHRLSDIEKKLGAANNTGGTPAAGEGSASVGSAEESALDNSQA